MSTPAPAASPLDQTLPNSAFWPAVSPRAIAESVGLASTGRDMIAVSRIMESMVHTNDALKAARLAAQALGYATLQAWHEAQTGAAEDLVNETPAVVHLYMQAVGALTKSRVIAGQPAQATRPTNDAAQAADMSREWWDEQYSQAIAGIYRRLDPGAGMSADFGFYCASIGPE